MYQASLIGVAGGKNAGDALSGNNWTDIDNETFLTMNPDVIVIPTDNFAVSAPEYTVEDVLADPNLAGCTAVESGNIYQLPSRAEAWDSPVPSGILGAVWLANVLHPEAVTEADCAKRIDAFYETFYGFTYSKN